MTQAPPRGLGSLYYPHYFRYNNFEAGRHSPGIGSYHFATVRPTPVTSHIQPTHLGEFIVSHSVPLGVLPFRNNNRI